MHPLPPPPGRSSRSRDQSANETSQAQSSTQATFGYVGENSASQDPGQAQPQQQKKRKHRGGKKKRNRRQSFAAPSEDSTVVGGDQGTAGETTTPRTRSSVAPKPFYKLGQPGTTMSNTSLESEALLDHRDQPLMRPRRDSRLGQSIFNSYRASPPKTSRLEHGSTPQAYPSRQRSYREPQNYTRESDDEYDGRDSSPLLATAGPRALYGTSNGKNNKRASSRSTTSSQRRRRRPSREQSYHDEPAYDYDVNNPPSVPSSPKLGAELGYDDVMVGGYTVNRSPENRREREDYNDTIIDIDGRNSLDTVPESNPSSPRLDPSEASRRTRLALSAEEDVCFPTEGMSELAEEDYPHVDQPGTSRRRRRRRIWPDLSILEDWSREEKEERSEGLRQMRISEPTLVDGRLRPSKMQWHRTEEEAPYRFTYFNEEYPSTIHAQTISELVQPGASFRELFIPDPPELSDSSDDEDDKPSHSTPSDDKTRSPRPGGSRQTSILEHIQTDSQQESGRATPQKASREKPKKYGPRPTFWLDVLSPTDAEMRVISKAFGIHALTAEDIMMQEAREKVELFRNYYFLNYRSFEQDRNSEEYLEPVDIYVVVFREGVLSFHFSQSPHPANVRRRIRQLTDYLILSSDWIAYAIIDDITDVFQPLIQHIEDEVDDIDDFILAIFEDPTAKSLSNAATTAKEKLGFKEKQSEAGEREPQPTGMDMLRRVGECRKKVMGLYRLLGNKADVIKGFAKRCNEQWEVAPKSEIGLYLGDIQDHILTMTSNLSHYETLLSRAHSNYLAQVNIRMNDRAEQNADVLGKLTVLGTIVLPLNVICGMWGMNVKVPGQDIDSLTWFWCLAAGMCLFAVMCLFLAKKVYHIV